MLEVEVKAQCPRGVRKKLLSLGARKLKTETQTDTYFNSPLRDFSKTDEALRVRKVGKSHFLTYKGPKLDSETKMREEFELEVSQKMFSVLERLGFVEVAVVKKKRGIFSFKNLFVCLDRVEGLGDFIEIEGCKEADKGSIFSLLKALGVSRDSCTRKSYLELLTETK